MHIIKRFLFFIPFFILLLFFVSLCDASKIPKTKLKDASRLIDEGFYREAEHILLSLKDRPESLFLLGRLYKEEGSFEKAEEFFRKSIRRYPLLKDYALISLAELYLSYGHFGKAIETVRIIKSPLLKQDAVRVKFNALIAMEKEDEAMDVLSQYVHEYQDDTEARFLLATLYKDKGMKGRAIKVFKDIYIMASDLSDDAMIELKGLKADALTKDELIERAGNLFSNHDYQTAIATYEKVMNLVDDKESILFEIGRCQFRLKEYAMAAESFKKVKGSKALYWQARSLFRIDDREGFNAIVERFEKEHPQDTHLADLLFISADDFRRKGELKKAEEGYKRLMDMFPQMREEALWGLGWMYYSTGDYERAFEHFSILKAHKDSTSYYKYLYWFLKACENISGRCDVDNIVQVNKPSVDNSYYGYLIGFKYSKNQIPQLAVNNNPSFPKPDGEVYDRISALTLLGMRNWALKEIRNTISRVRQKKNFFYLCNMAMMMDDYKTVIALNEKEKGDEYLVFSYPLGYWEVLKVASKRNGLDPYLVAALIREESRFDPEAVSWAGAIGLMQLMPQTAERILKGLNMGYTNHVDRNKLMDVRNNILIGSSYLSQLIREFRMLPYAIAAYNAGENAVRRWLNRDADVDIDEFIEDIPYKETRRYVKKVLKSYWQYRRLYGLSIKGFG
jgi:soluble lytic murein transglycosylase